MRHSVNDAVPPSDTGSPAAIPHRRRPRYAGKNPRRFEEKYKEHDPQRYGETVAKVLASGKTPAGTHRPIMVAEILEALAPTPGELAVDCTLGYGGHAVEIFSRIQPGGRLIGLDADPIELPKTEARLRAAGFGPETFTAVRGNFAGLPKVLAEAEARLWAQTQPQRIENDERGAADASRTAAFQADCILADLGVSSMQLDDPARGFSTKTDGPLDMRMNPQRGFPASALLKGTSPDALAKLLAENSDEPRAAELAGAIAGRSFATTHELAKAIRFASPKLKRDESDLTVRRVFQALRIAVNDEFSALDAFLRQLPQCLKPGGRVAVLTFHSGEDRRVKKAFQAGQRDGTYARISEEVVRASADEIRANPRSSSAKLRWAVRAMVPFVQ